MKKYIFITMNICNIGGSEQYIYNKTCFLEKNGYECFVFSSFKRKILIEPFERFKPFIIECLMYSPSIFTKKTVDKIVEKVLKSLKIEPFDTVYIESDGINQAEWGEIISNRLGCKHFFYNVQEVHNYSKKETLFLQYKFQNSELAGITNVSCSMMLGHDCFDDSNNIVWDAFCNNVVDNLENPFEDYLKSHEHDLIIGSIGRFDKLSFIPMLLEIKKFCLKAIDKKIIVVLIGGTDNKRLLRGANKLFHNIPNCSLLITGYLYPIPRSLIKSVDVFISTSGSASVSYYEHVPTIKINPINALPVGILGLTILNNGTVTMYDSNSNTTISEQIEYALASKQTIFVDDSMEKYLVNMNNEFSRQLSFMFLPRPGTYDTYKIYKNNSFKNSLYFFIGHIFGQKTGAIIDLFR